MLPVIESVALEALGREDTKKKGEQADIELAATKASSINHPK